MGVADIKARVEQLDRLARGLAKEVGLWRGCNDRESLGESLGTVLASD
jgi:hypothetical protein